MIKFVIFDMGRTLIDYKPMGDFILMVASEEMSKYLGIPRKVMLAFAEYLREKRNASGKSKREFVINDALREFIESSGVTTSINVDSLVDKIYGFYTKDLAVFPDVLETLQELKKRGLRIGLVSNTCFRPIHHIKDLEKFGLARFIDFMLFSSEFGWRKDNPKIYCRGLELAREIIKDLKPGEIIFTGDQIEKDVVGPQKAGMIGIHLTRDGKKEQGIRQISNLLEILDIVKEYNG